VRQQLGCALAAWRERRAIRANRPRNWILPDAALRDIAVRVPRELSELASTAELPEGILNNSGEEILSIIQAAQLPTANCRRCRSDAVPSPPKPKSCASCCS